jgi:hypothetical protein
VTPSVSHLSHVSVVSMWRVSLGEGGEGLFNSKSALTLITRRLSTNLSRARLSDEKANDLRRVRDKSKSTLPAPSLEKGTYRHFGHMGHIADRWPPCQRQAASGGTFGNEVLHRERHQNRQPGVLLLRPEGTHVGVYEADDPSTRSEEAA